MIPPTITHPSSSSRSPWRVDHAPASSGTTAPERMLRPRTSASSCSTISASSFGARRRPGVDHLHPGVAEVRARSTLAPRSWPSRPTLATTTRIVRRHRRPFSSGSASATYSPNTLAPDVGDLAGGRVGLDALEHGRHDVPAAGADLLEAARARRDALAVALVAHPPAAARSGARSLPRPASNVGTCVSSSTSKALTPTTISSPDSRATWLAVGAVGDASAGTSPGGSPRPRRPIASTWAIIAEIAASKSLRQRLDVVGAAERIGRVRDARLVGDDLVGADRGARRQLGRDAERLVEGGGARLLAATEDLGQDLQRDAGDVVQRLLSGQRPARGGGVQAEVLRLAGSSRRSARAPVGSRPCGPRGTWRPPRRSPSPCRSAARSRAEIVDLHALGEAGLDIGDARCRS